MALLFYFTGSKWKLNSEILYRRLWQKITEIKVSESSNLSISTYVYIYLKASENYYNTINSTSHRYTVTLLTSQLLTTHACTHAHAHAHHIILFQSKIDFIEWPERTLTLLLGLPLDVPPVRTRAETVKEAWFACNSQAYAMQIQS